MTNYRRGYEFEKRVKADLEGRGWVVIDSRGSHGTVDMVAIRRGVDPHGLGRDYPAQVLLVQAKRTLRRLRWEEWNALLELSRTCGAVPLLASMPGTRGIQYHRLLELRAPRKPISPHQIKEWLP